MNKHTPGPWLSRGKSDSVHESSDTHPYGHQIFRFAEDQGPSDDDLNLILSAPDLLEALEACRNELLSMINMHNAQDPNDGSWLYDHQTICEADLACARARGEA